MTVDELRRQAISNYDFVYTRLTRSCFPGHISVENENANTFFGFRE